jgi:hypothetical protein
VLKSGVFLHYKDIFNLKTNISMKANMGTTDKIIRIALAALVAILYFTNVITGTIGIVLLVVAAVFVLTSLISFCPLYPILGMNTTKKK